MKSRKIRVPRYLRELHGDYSDIFTLTGTYLAALISGAMVLVFTGGLYLPNWKLILLFILYADIAGGVVANFSSSTKEYYRANTSLIFPFIIIHLIHPILLIILFPDFVNYFLYAGLFTVLSSLTVIRIKNSENQHTVALTLFLAGTLFSFFFKVPAVFFYSFAPLYMLKLIVGFSLNRYES